jgi:hypothetical protein
VCRTAFITRFSTILSIFGASTGTTTVWVWTRIDRWVENIRALDRPAKGRWARALACVRVFG